MDRKQMIKKIVLPGVVVVVVLVVVIMWVSGVFKPAVVNGGWSEWGTCTIVNGKPIQTRVCNNPPAANGGSTCVGSDTQECDTQWQCMDSSVPYPTRVNKYGDIECVSNDGVHCLMGDCDNTLRYLPEVLKPVICTPLLYNIPTTWCGVLKSKYGI